MSTQNPIEWVRRKYLVVGYQNSELVSLFEFKTEFHAVEALAHLGLGKFFRNHQNALAFLQVWRLQ